MATITSPAVQTPTGSRTATLADLLAALGVSPDRVLASPAPGTATVEDVVAMDDHEDRLCELVDGVLVEKVMGLRESSFACVLIYILMTFLDEHRLGICTGPDGMIKLAPGLVRIPDVAFFSRDQFPDGRLGQEKVPLLSPTLAVEVLSESNTRVEMDRKLAEYFAAGSKLVWYLDPVKRTVRVYRSPQDGTTLDESQTLDGGDVLPGFQLPIREWFARVERPFGEV